MAALSSRLSFRGREERVFDVSLHIRYLDHIPVNSSRVWCVWSLPKNVATPHRGSTSMQVVTNNAVRWPEEIKFSARVRSKRNMSTELEPCVLHILVRSRDGSPREESIGEVTVDLAEFAGAGEVSRNILLQNSLLNSVLKISANVRLARGDMIFKRTNRGRDDQLEGSDEERDEDSNQIRLGSCDDAFGFSVGPSPSIPPSPRSLPLEKESRRRHANVRRALEKLPNHDLTFKEIFYATVFRPEEALPSSVLESRVRAEEAVDRLIRAAENYRTQTLATTSLASRKADLDLGKLIGRTSSTVGTVPHE